MSLFIKNGTVVNPAKQQNEVADVLVKDGKIVASTTFFDGPAYMAFMNDE